MKILRPSLLPALILSALSSGCGMLDAKLDAQTVCYTMPAYPITGVPVSGTLSTGIDYDIGSDLPILSEKNVSYTLVMTSMEVSVARSSPAVDLGGVDALDVSAMPASGTALPEVALVHYAKGTGTDPHPTSLGAASSTDQDLAPYVQDGRLRFLVVGTGQLPRYDWAADVKACFVLHVDVKYGEKL